MTWDDAQQQCNQYEAGLVKIKSAEENAFVLNLVKKKALPLKQVWIGLKYYINNFYWYDHSALASEDYKNWGATQQPNMVGNGDCVRMWIDVLPDQKEKIAGVWNACSCKKDYGGGVCKKLP